jgi:probable rRNA maturation factor
LIVIEPPSSDADAATSLAAGTKQQLARFLTRARKAVGVDGEVTVLLADDARLKELNRSFRRKNKPTDVLSFPAATNDDGIAGDIAISVETAARQAAEHGHTLPDELRILLLHGVLHIAGLDHETDKGEMRTREQELRTKFGLPIGLIERATPPARKAVAPKKSAAKSPVKRVAR